MPDYFDALETRSPAEREEALLAALPAALNRAVKRAPAIARQLEGIDLASVTTREALARIPVVRKHALVDLQPKQPPFGGFSAVEYGEDMPRVFASPGPIYEPQGTQRDYWRFGRALFAAGFRAGELAHNCFSYHFTPAGAMMESAAHAVGCTVFPGGIGQTEQQVRAIADLRPQGYVGTPSFLKIILEKADELGVKLESVHKALVSGEAFPPSVRDWFKARGVEGYQAYGTADVGLIAYETEARDGLVVAEDIILEIVRPGTNDPVPDGEVGEVVVTTFNPAYPLVRFGTGDLSAVMAGPSPCGRTNSRIKGWMGRADQTTKIRGMFVHPEQVDAVVKRFPDVLKARLVVTGKVSAEVVTLKLEISGAPGDLAERIAATARELTKIRVEVVLGAAGTLPNDGKVIEDGRSYE